MKVTCPECRTEVEYFTLKRDKTYETDTNKFGKLLVTWAEETPYCKNCKAHLYINAIELENNTRFKASVKDAQRKNVGFDYTDLQVKNKHSEHQLTEPNCMVDRMTINRFVIKFKDENTLLTLNELGTVTYRSNIINVVFLSTLETKEELLKVDGVISVNRERKGRLWV